MSLSVFLPKKCLWLADLLYGLPISVLFFCRETIWTLVLNQFSERLSLVLCQSKVRLHFLWSKITHDHFTILWSRITHDHFVKILKLAIMIHDHFADHTRRKCKHVCGGQISGGKNSKYYFVAFSNDKKCHFLVQVELRTCI